MKRKSNFEKRYPLLADRITDEVTRRNMLENNDLLRKYDLYSTMISIFIGELDKRFDKDTILTLIKEVVFKMPDELMVSVITAYLNSTEAVRSNANFLNFYNKTLHLGEDAVRYIEKNGIICSRKYLLIPGILIDERYNREKQGTETFKGKPLDELFFDLTYENKVIVMALIENSSFSILDLIFNSSNGSLNAILTAIRNQHLKVDIFNIDALDQLGEDNLRLLVYILMDMNYVDLALEHIKALLAQRRSTLLKSLIATRKIYYIYELTFEEITSLSDEEILKRLDKGNVNMLKKDE